VDKRTFLKVLGVGITVPILPKIVFGSTESLGNVNLLIGHDWEFEYYWLRVSIEQDGKDWHSLIRFTHLDSDQFRMLADSVNVVMRNSGVQGEITEQQVEASFIRCELSSD